MRFAYIDEAGISDPQREPVTIVAGVLVDADRQWTSLEDHFAELVERFVPHQQRDGFIFHAMDVWHGKGVFSRSTWKGDRHEVLEALCDTITKFQLPIAYGQSTKAKITETVPEVTATNEINRVAFMGAFFECAVRVEQWMREWAPDEVAAIVAENNNDLRKYAKGVHKIMRSGNVPEFMLQLVKELPLKHVIDTVYSAEKGEAPPLQLADLCAFLLKRAIAAKDDIAGRYVMKLAPSIPSLIANIKKLMEGKDDRAGAT